MVSSVLNTRLRPAKHSSAMARNWAPLKSIAPRSIARNIRSGMLVGPGLMKKWYPRLTVILLSGFIPSYSSPRPTCVRPAAGSRNARRQDIVLPSAISVLPKLGPVRLLSRFSTVLILCDVAATVTSFLGFMVTASSNNYNLICNKQTQSQDETSLLIRCRFSGGSNGQAPVSCLECAAGARDEVQ